LDVFEQSSLKMTLMRVLPHRQEVEIVQIFKNLLREIRQWRRQRLRKVRGCLALTPIQIAFDLNL
jgi:hypothetical protein